MKFINSFILVEYIILLKSRRHDQISLVCQMCLNILCNSNFIKLYVLSKFLCDVRVDMILKISNVKNRWTKTISYTAGFFVVYVCLGSN